MNESVSAVLGAAHLGVQSPLSGQADSSLRHDPGTDAYTVPEIPVDNQDPSLPQLQLWHSSG